MTIETAPGPHWLAHRLAVVLIVLLAAVAYAPALANDFTFDDKIASSSTDADHADPMISVWHPPWRYFAAQYWEGESKHSRLYRSITILSYAYTYQLLSKPMLPAEWEAFPHHLINLLLSAWAAYLVVWLMLDLSVCVVGALLTAALFGVHALHSEVVAGIVGRAELFSFCFGCAGLQAFRRGERGRAGRWSTLAALLFFAAMCSKESAVAWLAFLPCYLAARAWRADVPAGKALAAGFRRILPVTVPVLVAFLVVRDFAIEGFREDVYYAANPLYHASASERLLTAIRIWGYAIYKCVAPFSLAVLYGPPALRLVDHVGDLGFLAAVVVIAAWMFAGLRRPARTPLLFVSLAFFFGFSFLTSNVPFAIGTIFGERLYYTPSLGVCMLPALVLPALPAVGRRVLIAVCVAWMVANVVVDLHRSSVWKDNKALILNDVVAQPHCASLQNKAATMYRWLADHEPEQQAEHNAAAWRHLRLAQTLDPGYISAKATEAAFLSQDGEFDQAIAVLRAALALERLPISGIEASIRADLGMLLIREKKQIEAGLEHLARASELRPRQLEYRLALLDYGIGLLPPQQVQQILLAGLKHRPAAVMLTVMQAAFILEYAELIPENYQHVVDFLDGVFCRLPQEATGERRYITARLHLGEALRALGRQDEARAAYQKVLATAKASKEQKQLATNGLAELAK